MLERFEMYALVMVLIPTARQSTVCVCGVNYNPRGRTVGRRSALETISVA